MKNSNFSSSHDKKPIRRRKFDDYEWSDGYEPIKKDKKKDYEKRRKEKRGEIELFSL
jgi:hypothetical protein